MSDVDWRRDLLVRPYRSGKRHGRRLARAGYFPAGQAAQLEALVEHPAAALVVDVVQQQAAGTAFQAEGQVVLVKGVFLAARAYERRRGGDLQSGWSLDCFSSADRRVKLWNAETGSEQFTLLGHTDAVYALAFHPDGRSLVTAASAGLIASHVAAGQKLCDLDDTVSSFERIASLPTANN